VCPRAMERVWLMNETRGAGFHESTTQTIGSAPVWIGLFVRTGVVRSVQEKMRVECVRRSTNSSSLEPTVQ
jgi:hypothetical protein